MTALKLSVKFRVKNKIPFSIENLSGIQYRCGVCGRAFFSREKLDKHLLNEKYNDNTDLQFPEVEKNIDISVIYTQDIKDLTNPKYPKLKKGDKIFLDRTNK